VKKTQVFLRAWLLLVASSLKLQVRSVNAVIIRTVDPVEYVLLPRLFPGIGATDMTSDTLQFNVKGSPYQPLRDTQSLSDHL
jgi:hypothetical protein